MQDLIRVRAASVISLACAASLAAAVCGCSNSGPHETGWTIDRAESVTTIRGMAVRVRQCRGIGKPDAKGETRGYRRFACEAGARRPGESYDTVGVYYKIRLRGSGGYALDDVRFLGPGVP